MIVLQRFLKIFYYAYVVKPTVSGHQIQFYSGIRARVFESLAILSEVKLSPSYLLQYPSRYQSGYPSSYPSIYPFVIYFLFSLSRLMVVFSGDLCKNANGEDMI